MKTDLHIRETGLPKKVVIAGDQQLHSIMKDLQSTNSIHGDRHMLQLIAEIYSGMVALNN